MTAPTGTTDERAQEDDMTDTQTQIDELAAKMKELGTLPFRTNALETNISILAYILASHRHIDSQGHVTMDPVYQDVPDFMVEQLNKLAFYQGNTTPPGDGDHGADERGVMLDPDGKAMPARPLTRREAEELLKAKRSTSQPPAAPETKDAATWEDPRPWRAVADAYDEAYAALDDPMNFHDNESRVAGVQAAVAKAIERGLGAPTPQEECWTCHNTGVVGNTSGTGVIITKTECPTCGRRAVLTNAAPADRAVTVTEAMLQAGMARWFDEREESIADGIRGVIEAALRAERGEGE